MNTFDMAVSGELCAFIIGCDGELIAVTCRPSSRCYRLALC